MVMRESEVHDLIQSDKSTKNEILNILKKPLDTEFIHEDRYDINGIIADFTLLHQTKIVGTMECKGSDINTTDYVRGIGQVFQYEHFFEQKYLPKKGYQFDDNFNSALLITSSFVIRSNIA